MTLATISGDPEITLGTPATACLDITDNDSATVSIAKVD